MLHVEPETFDEHLIRTGHNFVVVNTLRIPAWGFIIDESAPIPEPYYLCSRCRKPLFSNAEAKEVFTRPRH